MRSPKKRPRFAIPPILLGGLALVLILFGAWGFWERYAAISNSNPVIPAETVSFSTAEPDETDLGDVCDRYRVADLEPRKISIPETGISGCIQKVGIDQHGAVAVPSNVHLAGWFVDSALPGEPGLSIIDGHVRGRYRYGIFARLHEVETGEKVSIEYGDGTMKEFEVFSVESYSEDQASAEMVRRMPDVASQLTLITCGGEYDKVRKTYSERVVVRARLVPPAS